MLAFSLYCVCIYGFTTGWAHVYFPLPEMEQRITDDNPSAARLTFSDMPAMKLFMVECHSRSSQRLLWQKNEWFIKRQAARQAGISWQTSIPKTKSFPKPYEIPFSAFPHFIFIPLLQFLAWMKTGEKGEGSKPGRNFHLKCRQICLFCLMVCNISM